MMLALYLLILALTIAAVSSRVLSVARWVYRAPRLALAAWQVALAAVVLSAIAALGALWWRWPNAVDTVCALWAWCVVALGGGLGYAAQVLGWLLVAVLAALVFRAGFGVARAWLAASARVREHRQLLWLVGRRDSELGALVVEHMQPLAYALADGTVVITTGVLDQLPQRQVTAVLAHERAHAAGHHHLMMRVARALHNAFPDVRALADAHRQIDRLVELCADDAATRQHSKLDLAQALVACAEAAAPAAPSLVPVGAAPAHGGDTLERVHRLLDPPPPLPAAARTAIMLGLGGLLAAPLAVIVLAQLFPILVMCLPQA